MQSSLAIAPACSNSSSLGTWPRSSSSPRVRSIVVSPTELSAMPASAIVSAVEPQGGARRRDRPVAGAPLDLLVGAARPRLDLEADLGEDLALLHRGRPRAEVELAHRHGPRSLGAGEHDRSLQRGADRGEILGRVGLAERAADRAAVAHDRVGDHQLGVAEDREPLQQQLGLEQLDVAGERADRDLVALLADVLQLREVVDVDQPRRLREPQLHHRQQAVAAGDDPRVLVRFQRRDRALQARRPLVLKRCWGLHREPRIGRGRWCR